MKLHHKEWPCVILTKPNGAQEDSDLHSLLPESAGTWGVWDSQTRIDRLYLYRSKTRFFQFSGSDEKLASHFEDVIYPRLCTRGRAQYLEYPLYAIQRRLARNTITVISAPYAGLLSEVVSRFVRPALNDGLTFARPLITNIYEMARQVALQPPPTRAGEALSPTRTSVILRGGRITLTVDEKRGEDTSKTASIRSLALMGTNILKSELFSRLVDEGIYGLRFSLDPSLAKVAFKRGNTLGVVVKMDQFGNYHYRPGFAGKNLDGVADLLAHCMAGKAVETSISIPLWRSIDTDL